MSKRLYVFLGSMGSGKTTIVNELSKELDLPIITTSTSRPKRDGESDSAYNFLDKSYFENNSKEFIEMQSYNTVYGIWYYGLERKSISNMKKDSLVVLSPKGCEKLIESNIGIDIIPIYVYTNSSIRLSRIEKRGDRKEEILRRLEADEKDFKYVLDFEPYIIYNNRELENAINQFKDILLEMSY